MSLKKSQYVASPVTSIKIPQLDWKDDTVSKPRLSRELENDLRDFFQLFAGSDGIVNPHDIRSALRQIRKYILNKVSIYLNLSFIKSLKIYVMNLILIIPRSILKDF